MPKGKVGRTLVSKTCVVCGGSFTRVSGQNMATETCSPKCRAALYSRNNSKKQTKTCPTCGGSFAGGPTQTYCSKACMYRRNDARFARVCECCGKAFRVRSENEPTRTCSAACGLQVRAIPHKGAPTARVTACRQCGKVQYVPPSHAKVRQFCSLRCHEAHETTVARKAEWISGSKNPAWKGGTYRVVVSASGRSYYRAPLDAELERSAHRRAQKLKATPKWADRDKIRAFYTSAQVLSQLSGTVYHVDHLVPLVSDRVCGLHNEFNLQVISGPDNLSKGNRYWPDM